MAEKTRAKKKNRREKKNEQEIRMKRMSVFGLRIETRDDFDENNYEDFQNVRREIKDTTQCHRIGPAPVLDFNTRPNHHASTSPGSLDSDLEDDNNTTAESPVTKSRAGCRGLIMYFAKLGRSEGDDHIDFEFVDSLLRGGADINFPDRHGQTCVHEIARSWHTDVAQFALSRSADIDRGDNLGRTPLHLATAVNYPEMVFWLLNNGAKIDTRTNGEHQTPIHYAAKYNAEDAMKVLLHMGASIEDRDYKNRTPLFVAAETGRSEACRFLLEQGAPAGVYDDGGTSALTLMIEKMPDIAKTALGQFEVVDKALRKKYFYLNYLESETWKRNATMKGKPLRQSRARTPLEAICRYNETELIMHPVILRLIAIKWQLFGKFHTAKNTGINLLYTILWTILGVTMPKTDRQHFYTPVVNMSWRITLEIISLVMAFYFIVKQIHDFRKSEQGTGQYKEWKRRETERDLQYCHSRWPEERRYLTSEMSLIKTSSKTYFGNGWNIFELFVNLALLSVVITRILACSSDENTYVGVHYKAFALFLIMLWLRFMRSCQCYQSLGPFITMLGHVITDTMKFGFLFAEFFIPYVCAFWILFGGNPNTDFQYFNDVIYQVFLMTLVDEYERDDIMKDDKVMAQILVGTYLAIASVVCVNLYIALMSQTFTRVYQNAKATAFMQQAYHLMKIERTLGRQQRNRVKRYMMKECSPQIIYDSTMYDDDDDDQSKLMMYRMAQSMQEIKDKLLVLVMNTTNNLPQATSVESLSLNDVNTQVEIVRRKCDSLESQLDDLQSYLHQIKDMIETKTITETFEFSKVDDLMKTLQKLPRDSVVSQYTEPKSNIDKKLDKLIDIINATYIQKKNSQNFAYENFQNSRPKNPTKYDRFMETDSQNSSHNYRDYRTFRNPATNYYDDRNYHSADNEHRNSNETLSEFDEFQRFREYKQHQRKQEEMSEREYNGSSRRRSPPSYDDSRHGKKHAKSGNKKHDYFMEERLKYNSLPSIRKQKKYKLLDETIDRLSRSQKGLAMSHSFDSYNDDYSDENLASVSVTSDGLITPEQLEKRYATKNRHNQQKNKRHRLQSENTTSENHQRRDSNSRQRTRSEPDRKRSTPSESEQIRSPSIEQELNENTQRNESLRNNSVNSINSMERSETSTLRNTKINDRNEILDSSKLNEGLVNINTEINEQVQQLEANSSPAEKTEVKKKYPRPIRTDSEILRSINLDGVAASSSDEDEIPRSKDHNKKRKSLHSLLKRYGLDPHHFEEEVLNSNSNSNSTLVPLPSSPTEEKNNIEEKFTATEKYENPEDFKEQITDIKEDNREAKKHRLQSQERVSENEDIEQEEKEEREKESEREWYEQASGEEREKKSERESYKQAGGESDEEDLFCISPDLKSLNENLEERIGEYVFANEEGENAYISEILENENLITNGGIPNTISESQNYNDSTIELNNLEESYHSDDEIRLVDNRDTNSQVSDENEYPSSDDENNNDKINDAEPLISERNTKVKINSRKNKKSPEETRKRKKTWTLYELELNNMKDTTL